MIKIVATAWYARRIGLLRLRRADVPLRLDCPGGICGLCCSVPGIEAVLTEEEAVAIPGNLKKHAAAGWAMRGCPTGCVALSNRRCSVYMHRPKGCREYPFYNVDGVLYVDTGCPGVKNDGDGRPKVAELARFESYFPGPRWLQQILLFIFRRW